MTTTAALLSHETSLDRRLQSTLNALDRLQRANQLSSSAPSHVLYPAGATPNRGIADVSATNLLHQIAPLVMPPDAPTPAAPPRPRDPSTSPSRQREPNEPTGPSLTPSIRIDTIEPNNPTIDVEPDDPPLGTATLPGQNEPDSPSHAPSTPRGTIEPNDQAPTTHSIATIEPNRPHNSLPTIRNEPNCPHPPSVAPYIPVTPRATQPPTPPATSTIEPNVATNNPDKGRLEAASCNPDKGRAAHSAPNPLLAAMTLLRSGSCHLTLSVLGPGPRPPIHSWPFVYRQSIMEM